jgi:hypothetical protein
MYVYVCMCMYMYVCMYVCKVILVCGSISAACKLPGTIYDHYLNHLWTVT